MFVCFCFGVFCNDMIIASARFKERKEFNDFATWSCESCVHVVWMSMCVQWCGRKKKKRNSLKCYFKSWKAVRDLPNVNTDLFFNLGLWCVPLPHVTLMYYTTFLCYVHPRLPCMYSLKQLSYEAMPPWVFLLTLLESRSAV